MASRERQAATTRKAALGVGFAAVAVAVLAAYADPARAYEPSLYRATPVLYWVGLAVALGASLLVALYGSDRRWLRTGAFLVAYLGFVSVAALPLVRGYHFLGAGDPLTHLGWIKELAAGGVDPLGFLYPAVHLTALSAGSLLGIPLTDALMVVVVVSAAVFLLFVPLCVRAATAPRRGLVVGLFAAGLFLPINNTSVYMLVHPFSQAVLFLPVVLYLLFRYVYAGPTTATPAAVLLVVAASALVLVHPQLGVGLVGLLLAVAGFQRLYRWWWPDHPVAGHRSLLGPGLAVGAFYLLWVANKPTVESLAGAVLNSILAGSAVGDEISSSAESTKAVGMSFEVMAFKLFFVSFVFSVLAGLVVLRALVERPADDRAGTLLVRYLAVGSVPLGLLFVVFVLSSISRFYFRYVGAIMAVVTILGAVAVTDGLAAFERRLPAVPVRTAVAVLFAVLLPLSLATVYFSPYILRGSGHVTEGHVNGYETAFEHRQAGTPFVGIRTAPDRQVQAVYGAETAMTLPVYRTAERVPPEVFDSNLSVHYEGPRYLPVRNTDRQVEVGLYDGLRYSGRGFRELDSTPGIDRVQSNGQFRLYRLERR